MRNKYGLNNYFKNKIDNKLKSLNMYAVDNAEGVFA